MTAKFFARRIVTLAVLCAVAPALAGSSSGGAGIRPESPAEVQADAPPEVPAGTSTAFSPQWSWPVLPPPRVVRQFDPPAQPWLPGHRGVDLAAARGIEVKSPAPGRVVFTGWVVDRPVVTVDHGGGLLSSFEPVGALVDRGELVQEGQTVGSVRPRTVSAGSHCPSACIHWGVRLNGEYVDPLSFVMDRRPSVLLPLHGP